MKLAISYSRVSSREQVINVGVGKGGLERQIERARKYCAKMSYVLDEKFIFQDKGVSAKAGANADIGELSKILAAIESKELPKGSVLIIENLDRLTRDHILEATELFGKIIRSGIEIVTLHDEKSYTLDGIRKQPMDVMYAVIAMLRASDENRRKIDIAVTNWAKSRKLAQETGIKDGHNLPKWLTLAPDKRTWIANKERVQVIKGIFSDYLAGASIAGLARKLNGKGITTNTGKPWMATTVKAILKNPAVIGEYHIGKRNEKGEKVKTGEVIRDYYPKIVDVDAFYRVQARLKLNPEKGSRPTRTEWANLFHGLIKCGYCGGAMMLITGKHKKSYICMRSVNGGCVRLATPVAEIEQHVLFVCIQITNSLSVAETDYAKIESLEGEIAGLEAKINNLVSLTAQTGDIEHATKLITQWKDQVNACRTEVVKEKSIDKLRSEYALGAFDGVLDGTADSNQRQQIGSHLRRIIERVDVFFAGDEFSEYKELVAEFEARGIKGGVYQHELKQKFKPYLKWYVRVNYRYPFSYRQRLFRAIDTGPRGLRFIPVKPYEENGKLVEAVPVNSPVLEMDYGDQGQVQIRTSLI